MTRAASWIVALILAAAAVTCWQARREQGRATRAEIESAARRDSIDVQLAANAMGDTVYVVRRDTLTRTLTRWKTVRDSVLLVLRDTVRVTDTLPPNDSAAMARVIASADTVLTSCLDVLQSCEARVAARDTVIGLFRRQVATLERRLVPPRVSASVAGGWSLLDGVPVAQGQVGVRVYRQWSVVGSGDLAAKERGRVAVLLQRSF